MRELPVPPSASTGSRVGPGAAAGISEEMIRRLVAAFYARVRTHAVLGPVFATAIDAEGWPEHEAKIADFWSSVLLMTGRFKGSPMAAHARRPAVQPEHFEVWLDLFARTARDVWPLPAAALVVGKAEMIGSSLRHGLSAMRGELPLEG